MTTDLHLEKNICLSQPLQLGLSFLWAVVDMGVIALSMFGVFIHINQLYLINSVIGAVGKCQMGTKSNY